MSLPALLEVHQVIPSAFEVLAILEGEVAALPAERETQVLV